MTKGNSEILLSIGFMVMLGATVEAQNWGLSAVLLDDQHYDAYGHRKEQVIKSWTTSGAPGLFQNGQFTYLDNSNFRLTASGMYYVTANIIGLLGKKKYDTYYFYRREFYGHVHVTDAQGLNAVDQTIESHVPLDSDDRSSKQINLKLSDYFLAQSGWQLSIKVTYLGRPLTIKAGSTLSLTYISQPFAFPGALLHFKRDESNPYLSYTTLELKSPSYSANIKKWSEREYSNLVSSVSEENFVAPVSGLYHVLANIQVERKTDVEYKFAILVDNSFEAVWKNVKLITEEKTTVTLEGVLNVIENQTISVSITSNNKTEARIDVMWSSFLSICLKGKLSEFVPGLSALFKTSKIKLPQDTWNTLTHWNQANQSPNQFGNIKLSSGIFRIAKSGYYYVSMSMKISNCSQASAKLNIKQHAIGPGFSFTSKQCHLDLSLLLHLNAKDTLQISVKSDQAFTVQPGTIFQVLLQTELDVWPAARVSLKTARQSDSNKKTLVKLTPWIFSYSQISHNMYFTLDGDKIKIKLSGLYIVSTSIIVKGSSTFQGRFESEVSVNGKPSGSGSKCSRNKTPQTFTCTISTLFNLLEDDFLTVLVKASDTSNKKQSVTILTTSSVSVILVGDTRSHPSFKLIARDGSTAPYVTKANTTTQKSLKLSDFTTTLFQTAPIYSKLQNSGFQTGPNNAYFISSSMSFDLVNDGEVSSSIGSTQSKEHVYGWDHAKGLTSVAASGLSYDSSFYFNFSGKASSSDFNWQLQPSVVSGAFIGNNQSLTAFKANINLKQKSSTQCSGTWSQFGSWTKTMNMRNLGTLNQDGFNVSQGGSYYVVFNLVITSSIAKKVIEVGVFVDNSTVLVASESTQSSSYFFSILLQGFIVLKPQQILDVRIKCPSPLKVTYSKDTSMSGFRINEAPLVPGLHWRILPEHKHYGSRNFIPKNYDISQRDSEFYTTGFYYNHSTSEMTRVPRTGVYFISFTGYLLNRGLPISLGFSNNSECTESVIPLYYKDTTASTKPVTASAFVFLKKGQVLNLPDTSDEYYHLYNDLIIYLSLHYMGDVQTTSGFTSTLGQEKRVLKGSKFELKDNSWYSGSTCGHFKTVGVPVAFGKYKALYKGFHVATFNLMLDYKVNCSILVCFVIDSHYTAVPKESCFERSMTGISNKTTSTIGGSRLIYFEEGDKVSIKLLKNTCQLTISKQSSLSVLYLGTNDALLGFSSVIATPKATLKTRRQKTRLRYYYWYSSHDSDSTTYDVQGWTTGVKNSKMFFQRGLEAISPRLTDMFVCPRSGVYLILVKLHVKSLKQSDGCVVGAKLAVDSQDIDLGAQIAFSGNENTLSFSSAIMLQRWQGLTVQFTHTTKKCGDMEITQGSLLAAIYLASGKTRSSEWPNNGPHIVQVPPSSITIRKDKPQTSNLVCMAVGKYPLEYQWINENKEIISQTSALGTTFNSNSTGLAATCVVKMGKFITESSSISIKIIDPTVVFIEDYENRTYDIAENFTKDRYSRDDTHVLTFGTREKLRTSSYRWWWWYDSSIRCSISSGNPNNTFYITRNYDYYYRSDNELFDLRAWKNHIDREITEEYNLTIVCGSIKYKDAANATALIHIVILDVNDNLPVFDKPLYNTTIPKNLRPGEDVIQVMATDDDTAENGEITYKLMYTSDSYIFVIDKKSGVISLSIDGLLAKPFYLLQVEATDQGNPPHSGYVMVVVDVRGFIFNRTNDHPIFDQTRYTAYVISVAPVGSVVALVHAYDPDTLNGKHIIYSIYSGDDTAFSIDPKRGIIKTRKQLSVKTYILEIAAEYADKPHDRHDSSRRRNITLVFIRVKDVDSTRPNFLESHYKAKVIEDTAINTTVLTVEAVRGQRKGKNKSSNSFLIYSIPTATKSFVIDPKSGQIRLAAKLDYETTKRYVFVVGVKTGDKEPQSSCTDVTIDITDANDNTPIITYATRKIILKKSPKIGDIIGQVNATDRDEGQNGEIRYYLEDYNQLFRIDPKNGTIFTTGYLDCCDVAYGVIVEVKDQGEPPRNTTVEIDIWPSYGGGGGGGDHHHHHGGHKGSSHTIVIVVSIFGGILVIVILGVIYYLRQRRRRNYETATRNYMTLASDDDEDDELLDDAANDEGGRRLSLISGTSDHSTGSHENLLSSEVNC